MSLRMPDHASSRGWRLQTQSNSLGANWSTVPGSTTTNRVIIPISPTDLAVFYRLAFP